MLESLASNVVMQLLFSGLDPLGLLQSRVNLGEILFKTGLWLSPISGSYPAIEIRI